MLTIRRAHERGHAHHGWLDTRHTFSFADYYDPEHMGFRALRVINEDRVVPGRGFGSHHHRDMEIITWVLSGALEHRDNLGNGSVIRPGVAQRMTAGTGVMHSEHNPSSSEEVHFLQIWIVPEQRGLPPSHEQKLFPLEERQGRLRLLASRDGREGSITVHQDVALYDGLLGEGETVTLPLQSGRYGWVQVLHGALRLDGKTVEAGDGVAVAGEEGLQLRAYQTSEVLVFDLA